MWEYIIFVILQALSLAGGQAMFKLFVDKLGEGGCWAYVLKKMDFSQAYPLSSLSFIFGMFLAFFLFQESIPFTRWIGVVLIVVGCVLISMK